MTSPRRARRTDGGGGGGGGAAGALAGTATLRGGLLIGAAVVLGVVLLGKGFDSGFLPSSSTDPSDELATGGDDDEGTDEGEGGDDGTTTTVLDVPTHPPAEVQVQVLNSSAPIDGSAGAATDALEVDGYVMLEAENAADQSATASAVYAIAGYEADAQVIATRLGIAAEPQAMPATPPAPAVAEAQIVIVLGPDFTPPTG